MRVDTLSILKVTDLQVFAKCFPETPVTFYTFHRVAFIGCRLMAYGVCVLNSIIISRNTVYDCVGIHHFCYMPVGGM